MIPLIGTIAGKAAHMLWRRSKKAKVVTILTGIVATLLVGWGLDPELAKQVAQLIVELMAD